MYYDNKQTFYIKQYGPTFLVAVISFVLIASGVFIYVKSSNIGNPLNQETEVAQTANTDQAKIDSTANTQNLNTDTTKKDDNVQETNALVDDSKPNTEVVKYFNSLPALEKSKDVNVTNVNADGTIDLEIDGDKLEVTLIGVDFKYAKNSVIDKMRADLVNNKVKIAFDNLRTQNNLTFAYIFYNNKLYNAELLKTGLVTLKTERQNIQLNKDLASAQAYARQNSLGVWNK